MRYWRKCWLQYLYRKDSDFDVEVEIEGDEEIEIEVEGKVDSENDSYLDKYAKDEVNVNIDDSVH